MSRKARACGVRRTGAAPLRRCTEHHTPGEIDGERADRKAATRTREARASTGGSARPIQGRRQSPRGGDSRRMSTTSAIMPVLELMTSSGLGSLLGMRHALEPDHLAAVSTLVSGERSGARPRSWAPAGASATRSRSSPSGRGRRCCAPSCRVGVRLFEFGVAIMLVGLGVRAIYLAARQGPAGPAHLHHHGRAVHVHPGATAHVHIGAWTLARRPLLVGAVHGLAGSGALTALVLATLPIDRGAPHLHGALRSGIDAGDGRALGALGLAAGAHGQSPRGRARRVAGRRPRLDGARRLLRLHFTATVQLTATFSGG